MKSVLNHIEAKQDELTNCEFLTWLRNKNTTVENKMKFTPAMILFVMGFKDITEILKTSDPQNEVDHIINTHCDEDAGHWIWYLNDLKKQGVTNEFFGDDVLETFGELWSGKYLDSRMVVYEIVSLIKTEQDRLIHLTILEVLEATFGAFISSMSIYFKSIQNENEFQFFGQEHMAAEEAHESGNWTEGQDVHSELEKLTFYDPTKKVKAIKVVDDLFQSFEKMFSAWHEYALNSHQRDIENFKGVYLHE